MDGSGFRLVLSPSPPPPGLPQGGAVHHAVYAPDGSIVFEGEWGGEAIWRLPAGATTPVRITGRFNNDNTPCVLPDGWIVSVWLGRPGNASGVPEIKVMAPDGSNDRILLSGAEFASNDFGCSS